MNLDETRGSSGTVDGRRRRFLRGVAGVGVALSGVGTAAAREGVDAITGRPAALADEVVFDGFRNVATGSADLEVSNDNLYVSNFDGGLDDGTCVPLDDVEAFQAQTTLDREDPLGSARRFLARGNIDGQSGQQFGYVDVERIDSPDGFSFLPTFENLGADSYGVQLYDDGSLVHEDGDFTGESVADMTQSTSGISTSSHLDVVEIWVKWVWSTSGFWIVVCIDVDLTFVLPDGTDWIVDEIWFCPWNPTVDPGLITECDIFGLGMAQFVVFAEELGSSGFE